MNDESAFPRVEQKVFRPPGYLGDQKSVEFLLQIRWHRPAQRGISYRSANNAAALDIRCDASTDNLYFWKLRHEFCLRVVFSKGVVPALYRALQRMKNRGARRVL